MISEPGEEFFALWLDESMSYSSGRYVDGAQDLTSAQTAKFAALARLIKLTPEDSLLDLGCGWGGFAIYAASVFGAKVTGIDLAASQVDSAGRRIEQLGLRSSVCFRCGDYRDLAGRFDKIVSIEMFEAIGQEQWGTFFRKIHDLLKPGGRVGLQTITIRDHLSAEYRRRGDYIQNSVFGGGMLPTRAEFEQGLADAGLILEAFEPLTSDYAKTVREWRRRFDAKGEALKRLGYDARFVFQWRSYLAQCELGFSRTTEVGQWAAIRPRQ